jgi:putative RNA 2'-phosphotransferase
VIYLVSLSKGPQTAIKTDKKSRFLSLVLRHKPETIGIQLDQEGWVDVGTLLSALAKAGKPLKPEQLQRIVETNSKKRFSFSKDGRRIRAVQGHSIQVDLKLTPALPPELLFHGTPDRFVVSILAEGIKAMDRHHVHLSQYRSEAFQVGSRRGKAVLLSVRARQMCNDGHEFFVADNGVWLTSQVPKDYLEVIP